MYLNNYKKYILLDFGTISFCLCILLVFTNSNRGIVLAGEFIPVFITIIFWGIESIRQTSSKRKISILLLLFLLCTVAAGFTCIAKRNIFELGQFITFIIWGILFLLFVFNVKTFGQFYGILYSCTMSGMILSCLIIFSKEKYDLDLTRGSFHFMEQNMLDPNFLATFICLGIFTTCYLLIYQKKHRMLNLIAVFIMLIGMCLTGSRAGFLYVLIAFIGLFLELYYLFKPDSRKVFALFIVTILLAIITTFSLYRLKPEFFQRFFLNINAYIGDGSNQKRLHHWVTALRRISDAPFWGYGTTSEPLIMSDPISDTSHNTFLSFYIRLGLPGLISFCLIVARIFYQAMKRKQYFLLFIIMGFIINISIIPATMSYVTWISLMVFYMLNQYMEFLKTDSDKRKLK